MPWKAYFRIIRPLNLVIMVMMLVLVRYAIFLPVFRENRLEGLMPGWMFLMLVAATVFIAAGGYVINDVLDIETDRINKPGKQVIGRQISDVSGNRLHMNLTVTGVLTGLVFGYLSGNVLLGVIFVIIATSLFYYSFKYKYMPLVGNLVVALLSAMVVMIYWLFEFYYLKTRPEDFIEASASFAQINRFVFAFALFAFLTTLTREIIKDAQDIEGDARFGCRTLPVVLGTSKLRFVLIALEMLTLSLLAWFQFRVQTAGYKWMAFSLIFAEIALLAGVYMTIKARDKTAFARLSQFYKLIMIAGMLSLVAAWFRIL